MASMSYMECCNEMINGEDRMIIKIALNEAITPNHLAPNYAGFLDCQNKQTKRLWKYFFYVPKPNMLDNISR